MLIVLFTACQNGPTTPANAGKIDTKTTQKQREEMGAALNAMTGKITLHDGRLVEPNLFFDFEEQEQIDGIRTQTNVFTGKWSHHIPEGNKFGPTVVRKVDQVSDGLAAVQVSCWVWCAAPDPRVAIKINAGSGLFGGMDITKQMQQREHNAGEWEQFNAELLIRDHELAGDDEIIVSLINRNKDEVFIDDLAISYLSKDVLRPAAQIKGAQ